MTSRGGTRENVPAGAELVVCDIGDARVRDLFRDVRFELVSHHAAQIDVRVSVSDPARDARVNVLGLLNLTEAAIEAGDAPLPLRLKRRGRVWRPRAPADPGNGAPRQPLSPYGVSKLAGEHYLQFYQRVHGLEYVALRYANVYGPRQDPHGEAGVVAIFANRLLHDSPLHDFWERRTDAGLRVRGRRRVGEPARCGNGFARSTRGPRCGRAQRRDRGPRRA